MLSHSIEIPCRNPHNDELNKDNEANVDGDDDKSGKDGGTDGSGKNDSSDEEEKIMS